jgi:hypothetical protein
VLSLLLLVMLQERNVAREEVRDLSAQLEEVRAELINEKVTRTANKQGNNEKDVAEVAQYTSVV